MYAINLFQENWRRISLFIDTDRGLCQSLRADVVEKQDFY